MGLPGEREQRRVSLRDLMTFAGSGTMKSLLAEDFLGARLLRGSQGDGGGGGEVMEAELPSLPPSLFLSSLSIEE